MSLDFRAQMLGGNKRKINNRLVIEAVLHAPISKRAHKILKKLERREQ